MATTMSFQGVTTGLQTDNLIKAIIARDSGGVERLQGRQALNVKRSAALASMRSGMTNITVSMAKLFDSFANRAVTSSDSTGAFATATATGAASGSYEVKVASVATKGQLGPTMVDGLPTTLAMADANTAITSGTGNFTVTGTDGVAKTFELTNNSLNGLRDAINASGAGVTATVVNSGKGGNQYQLVLTAKETGTGTTSGVVSLRASGFTSTEASLGDLAGGLSSTPAGTAKDAVFSINGIEMTRKSNVVTDAVDGVTFTLKKGDATNTTTLTVGQDKANATAAMQDVIAKFNAVLKTYKDASAVSKTDTGVTNQGPLTSDVVARSVINDLRSVLRGNPDGLPDSATFKSAADLGIKTNADGTLSLDTTIFQAALDKDPVAVKNVFAFSGSSTNGAVSFASGGSKTATGAVDFAITSGVGGALTGSLTVGGTTYADLSVTNGVLTGPAGTPLEGLKLNVTGPGTGALTLTRGIGSKLQDLITSLTSYSGTIETTRTSIEAQNKILATRIESGQANLEKKRLALKAQFDKMESMVSQLRAASSSLSGI